MRAISAPEDMFLISKELLESEKKIGLVPTMGALHTGHLELVKRSLAENDKTVVSIFVNPLQFNKKEDLEKYPRTLDEDAKKLERLGVDFVFHPTGDAMYKTIPGTSIFFGNMENVMEGKYRPGHFNGVGIVVSKLFNLVIPSRAYFGLKDFQQVQLIRKMTEDLSFPVEVVGVDTVREESGLAMSSRNLRLSPEGLSIAANIYKGLMKVKSSVLERNDLAEIKSEAHRFYSQIAGLEIEYLEIVDGESLETIKTFEEVNELAICFAGYVEGVRLIDNLYLRLK